jgi:hypothetical protein
VSVDLLLFLYLIHVRTRETRESKRQGGRKKEKREEALHGPSWLHVDIKQLDLFVYRYVSMS